MKAIVVGGGILGASTAFHLASSGVDVTMVDRGDQGRATAAGAGIICPWGSQGKHPDYYNLSCAGARYYPELVAALAENGEKQVSYRKVGALSLRETSDELDKQEALVRERVLTHPEAGEITRLSGKEAQRLFPPLRDDFEALFISGGARIDGRSMATALTGAAQKSGAKIIQGDAVLMAAPSRVRGVIVGGETHEADAVIVCAGAWAPALLEPIGVHIAVSPQRGQIIHLRLQGADTRDWPALLPLSDKYLLAFDDGRVVIGATWEPDAGFDYRSTAGGMAEILNGGLAVAPGLASATIIETRIGFRPVSRDTIPLLGPISGLDGLFIGNGLGSNGLTMGPFGGLMLSQLVLGQRPALDPAPYDPTRLVAA